MMRKILICIFVLFLPTFFILSNGVLCAEMPWSDSEQRFIAEHPVIRLGVDPSFVPFEFLDKDGEYKGITADYLDILSEKTGLEFVVTPDLSWPQAYEKALAGDLDVLPAVSKTIDREKHFLFSDPYYAFKRVIVTQDTHTGINSIEDLNGMTAAVQKNSSHHSYLLSFPEINLSLYDSVEAAITAVANGTETCFVGNLATTNYLIRSNSLTNLKFIAFEAEKNQTLLLAVRKDWPELISIINKVLNTITEEEKILINNKWIAVQTEIDYGPIIRTLLIIGSIILVTFIVSAYWIIQLRKEVDKRKKIQIALEKAKLEAEDANDIKSNFLARMSHEIRTPLNAITGMAYLLKKTSLTLTQRNYTERITQASANMLSIINDILDFSKIEAGKVELETVSFNLDQVIQDVVSIVSYKIEEQEIGFILSKDPFIPNWFFGDAKRIEQILLNVINNAAKFTTIGEVSLDVRLEAKESGKYHLAFTIRDTGIGMSENQVKNLFEPFRQGDVSINRRFGGTGLGLSIVKNLVDMMKGQMQVFSTEGEGTTFIIHLVLEVDKKREDDYRKQVFPDCFKNVRTLVLEKTGSNMNVINSYLRAFGMDCELTTSASSAKNMLETANGKFSKPFDLFIVDYDTPEEGGIVFIKTLNSSRKIVKLPKFILLLPLAREDLFDKLEEAGIDAGIGKPVIQSILFNNIIEMFQIKAIAANRITVGESPEQAGLPLSGQCVLVVEDNKTNQLIAKSLLEQAGLTILMASDGKSGLDTYKNHAEDIDLILMDLHMPILNGYDSAMEIRKISQTIPIIAMTADVIKGVKEKCEAYGIHDTISKPFDPECFIQTIKNILIHSPHNKEKTVMLDHTMGLRNIGGDVKLYQAVLNEYSLENVDTAEKVALAVREKRYADARQLIHKVKSSSGSIGANKFYQVAADLQKALEESNEDNIGGLHHRFNRLMIQLLDEIHVFINMIIGEEKA